MSSLKALSEAMKFCRTTEDLRRVNPIVRFLVLARVCVIFMSIYSVVIGGLTAWIYGSFNPLIFGLILIGFTLLHLADNLLNDYSDTARGIDTSGYERLLYAPHPIKSGLLSIGKIKLYVASTMVYASILAIYLTLTVSPLILVLTLVGIFIMLGYSGYGLDLKRLGLGEIGVFIVWGPVMAGGTFLALTGVYTLWEALIYTPYALTVSLVLIGKHLDKFDSDYIKRVYTLPIRLGYRRAKKLCAIVTIIPPLLASLGIYLYTGSLLTIIMLTVYPLLYPSIKAFLTEKPSEKPEDWNIWPLWYAAWGYLALDIVGRYLILTLIIIGSYIHGMLPLTLLSFSFFVASLLGDLRKVNTYLKYIDEV